MTTQDVLLDVGFILLAGVVAIPLAALLRLPGMLLLLAAGVLIGPVGRRISSTTRSLVSGRSSCSRSASR